jgi:PAS domain S-box-containing protein
MKDEEREGQREGINRDISVSPQEWVSVFQASRMPVLVLDSQYIVIAANPATTQLTGKPAEEILGKTCYEIFHGKDTATPPEGCPMEKLIKSGHLEPFEFEMKTPGGFFSVSCTPVFYEQGNLKRIIYIGTDITERKLAEQKYKNILETSIDGFAAVDTRGRFLEANDAYCRMTGFSHEELLRMSVQDMEAMENPEENIKHFEKVIAQGNDRFESKHRRKDGTVYDVEISVQYSGNQGGMLIAFVRDITERRQAEEILKESKERLLAAVRLSQIGIFDHNQRTDTVYWSPQQRVIHGWGPDEPVTLQAFLDLVHPEDREKITESVRHAHDPAGDGIWDVEHRIIRRDGSIRWLKGRAQTFFEGTGDARRPVCTIGAVLDITKRKQIEMIMLERGEILEKIFDATHVAIVYLDKDSNISA